MTDQLIQNYADQMKALKGSIPALDDVRQKAFEAFSQLGIPAKKHENWRYANIAKLRKSAYGPAGNSKKIAPEIAGDFAATFTYVNGTLDEEQCSTTTAMEDIRFSHLSNSLAGNADRVGELLTDGDGIILLNTALMHAGFVLNIPAGIEIEKPILIHHIVSQADDAAVHMRHTIEMGEGSKATIIQCFSGDNTNYWHNNVLQVRVSQGADLMHLRLLTDGNNAVHTGKIFVDLDADSHYRSFTVATGGEMMRSESHVRMLGEGAKATLDCIALAAPHQTHDVVTHIDHAVPNAVSDQMFRAIVAKQGTTAFQGKVIVQKGAQHTLADQACNSILLDRSAEANAKPELEIWADDVKCSHGATVGELDDKALFYLNARGIDPVAARALLIEAFIAEVIERIEAANLKEIVTATVQQWLSEALGNG